MSHSPRPHPPPSPSSSSSSSSSVAPSRLSFEFFPPRSDAQSRRFWRTFGALETLAPDHVSLTWGALGSDSAPSLELLEQLVPDTDIPVVAHLSCIGQTREQLRATLDRLEAIGVERVLALRGDAPDGATLDAGSFRHADELVSLLAEERPHLAVSVAAYPETHPDATSADSDLRWLRHKLERGAGRAYTQFFFEPATFLRWRDRAGAAGIEQPLVPGILPVHDIDKVQAFAGKCGSSVPPGLVERFERIGDAGGRESLAVETCVELCRALEREGVDEFHLYTLNRARLSREIAVELLGREGEKAVVTRSAAA